MNICWQAVFLSDYDEIFLAERIVWQNKAGGAFIVTNYLFEKSS